MSTSILTRHRHFLLVLALASLLTLPFLGANQLFDWDEINFAEGAREMLERRDPLRVTIDYEPFYEKPPLYMWLQALSFSAFGVSEFTARLPNFLINLGILFFLYRAGTQYNGIRFGLLWALAYAGSVLPFYYFRFAVMDPLFNLLIFSSIWSLVRAFESSSWSKALSSGALLGLAILTKGPVALLVAGLTLVLVILFRYRDQVYRVTLLTLLYLVSTLVVASLWFVVEYLQNGSDFIREFFVYQVRLFSTGDAGHSGPFYYHVLVLLFGCFPASVFAVRGLTGWRAWRSFDAYSVTALVLFWVVLILFSIVKTKIVHYSSLCYFPLSFFAAQTLLRLFEGTSEPTAANRPWYRWLVPIIGFPVLLFYIGVPLAGWNMDYVRTFLKDSFTKAVMTAPVEWSLSDFLPAFVLLVGIVTYVRSVRQNVMWATAGLFVVTGLSVALAWVTVIHKVEGYTQRIPVEYYQSVAGTDTVAKPLKFKSYAHLFYSRRLGRHSPSGFGALQLHYDDSLRYGTMRYPVVFVVKSKDSAEFNRDPRLRVQRSDGGWVFYQRLY